MDDLLFNGDGLKRAVHPTAIIHTGAKLGIGVEVGPYAVIYDDVVIGSNTKISSHAVIGSPAEKRGYFDGSRAQPVYIGEDCYIREYVTINAGTIRPTTIGNRCLLLRGSHVGHDSVIDDDVTLSCDVLIGGETMVQRGANLGLGAVTHQRSIIGAYSIVGMNSTVTKKSQVIPFNKYAGTPVVLLGANHIAIDRAKLDSAEVERLQYEYQDMLSVWGK